MFIGFGDPMMNDTIHLDLLTSEANIAGWIFGLVTCDNKGLEGSKIAHRV